MTTRSRSEESGLKPAGEAGVMVPVTERIGRGERIVALDAYRGFIMVLLVGSTCFEGLKLPRRALYDAITYQFDHRAWGGAVFYDLIMPAFLLMVGVAMSYSVGRRMLEGEDKREIFKHFLKRAAILVVISQVVISIELNHLHLQFHNILTHVAFTSVICFFIMQLRPRYQVIIAVLLLAVHSALYLVFPGSDGAFQMGTNFGSVLDRLMMGRNYTTTLAVNLNLMSETVNVLAGIWIGNLIQSPLALGKKFWWMLGGAAVAFVSALAMSPVVPINKWLWTASYALYTIGWSVLGLAFFYFVDVVLKVRRPLVFFVVVGMNALIVYCIGEVLVGWIRNAVEVLTVWLSAIGEVASVLQACLAFLVIWYVSYWLYRRKIFIRA
jgi:predicted acyltransferase